MADTAPKQTQEPGRHRDSHSFSGGGSSQSDGALTADDVSAEVLTKEEKAYLRKIIKDHFEFYRTVAESSHCTPGNRKIFALVSGLWQKLQ
jgi:hypothetical protein